MGFDTTLQRWNMNKRWCSEMLPCKEIQLLREAKLPSYLMYNVLLNLFLLCRFEIHLSQNNLKGVSLSDM